jgi:hypothetical protein
LLAVSILSRFGVQYKQIDDELRLCFFKLIDGWSEGTTYRDIRILLKIPVSAGAAYVSLELEKQPKPVFKVGLLFNLDE